METPSIVEECKKTSPNYKKIKKLLESSSVIDATDAQNTTPIIAAAKTNNKFLVVLLLSYNPDLTKKDEKGYVALHYACMNGNETIVKLLVEYDYGSINITTAPNKEHLDGLTSIELVEHEILKTSPKEQMYKKYKSIIKYLTRQGGISRIGEEKEEEEALDQHNRLEEIKRRTRKKSLTNYDEQTPFYFPTNVKNAVMFIFESIIKYDNLFLMLLPDNRSLILNLMTVKLFLYNSTNNEYDSLEELKQGHIVFLLLNDAGVFLGVNTVHKNTINIFRTALLSENNYVYDSYFGIKLSDISEKLQEFDTNSLKEIYFLYLRETERELLFLQQFSMIQSSGISQIHISAVNELLIQIKRLLDPLKDILSSNRLIQNNPVIRNFIKLIVIALFENPYENVSYEELLKIPYFSSNISIFKEFKFLADYIRKNPTKNLKEILIELKYDLLIRGILQKTTQHNSDSSKQNPDVSMVLDKFCLLIKRYIDSPEEFQQNGGTFLQKLVKKTHKNKRSKKKKTKHMKSKKYYTLRY